MTVKFIESKSPIAAIEGQFRQRAEETFALKHTFSFNPPPASFNHQVCEEEEVLELDAQRLGNLLCSDDLNISQEQVLLELVLRWAQRRRGDLQSETEAAELLRYVRLELVDPAFLRKARRRNPVRVLFSLSFIKRSVQ